jgi:hypothetical protein
MISRQVIYGALGGVTILAGALALKWAQHNHLVSAEFVQRGVLVIIGLYLAIYANFIPKKVPGLKISPARAARVQAASRLNGWLFCFAGLGYAAIWAFAPLGMAFPASIAVVGGAMVVVLTNLGICIFAIDRKDARAAH